MVSCLAESGISVASALRVSICFIGKSAIASKQKYSKVNASGTTPQLIYQRPVVASGNAIALVWHRL
ncbi:MAG: hypothetical protein LH649_04275 [Pseudanabaena sp. CAN_BIN31]|nr:hypothetical protein [Pseudanabaena sp. CAN_BIN31]